MSDIKKSRKELAEALEEQLKGNSGSTTADIKRRVVSSPRASSFLKQKVLPTEVNVVLTPDEVSAIIQKLVDEKLVVPNVGGNKLPNGGGNVSLISNGCCVDASVSVGGPASTIGVNHPTRATEEMKKALTKDTVKVNVKLPDNIKLK